MDGALGVAGILRVFLWIVPEDSLLSTTKITGGSDTKLLKLGCSNDEEHP